MAELEEGESIEIEGRKGRRYFLSKNDDVYSCTCVSFQRNRDPHGQRMCKHIDKFLCDPDEETYIVEARSIAKMRASGIKVSSAAKEGHNTTQNSHPQMIVEPGEIEKTIERLSFSGRLWLDTEVADWKTGNGRLSLIQILSEGCTEPSEVILLDVLHHPDLVNQFVSEIMKNSEIEKVFHNAAYDLQYLGNERSKSVACTLEVARYLSARSTSLPKSLSLKSLSQHFRLTRNLSKEEQKSDWSVRPLSKEQIEYAIMDVVYLRMIHLRLIEMSDSI